MMRFRLVPPNCARYIFQGFFSKILWMLFAVSALHAQDTSGVTLYAAGDVSMCDPDQARDEATSALILRDTGDYRVAALGDLAYETGQVAEWKCYDLSWGRFKAKTIPVIGNHDTYGGSTFRYYDYFNGVGVDSGAAGQRKRGRYWLRYGDWLLIVLNTEYEVGTATKQVDRERAGIVEQSRWLGQVMRQNPSLCQMMLMHRTLFSSSVGGVSGYTRAAYDTFYKYKGDVVASGHVHKPEVMRISDPAGNRVPGFRQFVSGTGGKLEANPWDTVKAYTLWRGQPPNDGPGVLKFTLMDSLYRWQFLDTLGTIRNEGQTVCK